MEFNQLGHLKEQQKFETIDELKLKFVNPFTNSISRSVIFDDFTEYVALLKSVLPNKTVQWINGSFVTLKTNPRDIDVVTFVDFTTFQNNELLFEELRKWRFDPKRKVDGYFVKTYPENHPNFTFYEFDKLEWQFLFQQTKNSKNKKHFVEQIL